jgi:phage terminase large subunit GpA-like protein
VLQAVTDPDVEEISLKWSTQLGKTLASIIAVFYFAKHDPWPALHVMPRDEDAESVNIERYQPVLRESPSLADLREGARYSETRDAIHLGNGMVLYFTGANSPAGLASRSVCILILDEVNKWPPWSGREADPISLARERTRWFPNRKIIKSSTPTTEDGYITREYDQSTRERYFVPCPLCGAYQVLVWGTKGPGTPGIKWPAEVDDPVRIEAERLAWYECAHCHGRILDAHRPEMLRRGRWVPEGGEVLPDGSVRSPPGRRRHVGYHLWAAYSPLLTYSEIVAKFLRSKDKPETLMNFVNSWLAEEWRVAVNELRAAEVRARADTGLYEGEVADKAWLLTAGVDVQRPGGTLTLYYVIRAWGPEEESWLVKHGTAVGWEELYQVLFRSVYRNRAKDTVQLQTALVDSGDGVSTLEVYDWCGQTGCIATKGASRPTKPTAWSNVDRGSTQLPLLLVHTGYYKSKLHRMIRTGKWHLPLGMDEEYFTHMSAEQLVQAKGKRSGRVEYRWQVLSPGAPNHYFDCEVLALVGAELLNVPFSEKPPIQSQNAEGLKPTVIRERIFQ